jgi:hypothetical protein
LSELCIYVTEVAGHIGAAASKVTADLKRNNKAEFHSDAIDLAHSILIEAHAWIDRTEEFVPSDAAPTKITEGFFAWMEDVAKAQYLLPRQTSRSKPQR